MIRVKNVTAQSNIAKNIISVINPTNVEVELFECESHNNFPSENWNNFTSYAYGCECLSFINVKNLKITRSLFRNGFSFLSAPGLSIKGPFEKVNTESLFLVILFNLAEINIILLK